MKIGIGIITRNRNDIVKKCLDNIISNLSYPLDTTIVVIDDASNIAVKDDRVKIERFDFQRGVSAGKNACLRLLNGSEHFFLFDDDCWPIKMGWEDLYIETANHFKHKALCFTWESLYDNTNVAFFEVIKRIIDQYVVYETVPRSYVSKKTFIVIDDKHLLIKNEVNLIAEIVKFKENLCVHRNYPHAIKTIDCIVMDYGLKMHKHCCGVMIYLHNECVETIGGFCNDFGLYGGEHDEYFRRAYNAKLIDFIYPDAENSEKYFYAMDRDPSHKSIISDDDKAVFSTQIEDVMKNMEGSTKKIEFL